MLFPNSAEHGQLLITRSFFEYHITMRTISSFRFIVDQLSPELPNSLALPRLKQHRTVIFSCHMPVSDQSSSYNYLFMKVYS